MTTFGFIGTGNMGGALAQAVCKAVPPTQVLLANRTPEKAQRLAAKLGCRTADNHTIADTADWIFLGVKPQMMPDLLADIAPTLANRQNRFLLVTMAAGLSIARIQELAGGNYPVVRIMPNTPVSIGEGIILYMHCNSVTNGEKSVFLSSMAPAGQLIALPEHLMDVGSALSGCGPAFVDLFIEALADGGVACGLPRAQALTMAAQMVAGSAQLVLSSGKHPAELKDAVCSPGGSTIQGVRALEQAGFRSAAMNAVIAAYEKTLLLQ